MGQLLRAYSGTLMRITDTKFSSVPLLLLCRGASKRAGWDVDIVFQSLSRDLVVHVELKGSCSALEWLYPFSCMRCEGSHLSRGSQLEHPINHPQPVEDVNKGLAKWLSQGSWVGLSLFSSTSASCSAPDKLHCSCLRFCLPWLSEFPSDTFPWGAARFWPTLLTCPASALDSPESPIFLL